MIGKYGTLNQHDPIECPDCTIVSDGTNASISTCQRGRDLSAAALANARATNPEIDAVHRMIEARRG